MDKKNTPVWPGDTIALLAKRINDLVIGQDYIDWAEQAMSDGFDSPSLTLLASLDMEGDFSRFEAEKLFQKVIEEFEIPIPDNETILRKLLFEIAEQIKLGAIEPTDGVNRIHREIVNPLNHPRDLQSWCFLWEGIYPKDGGRIPESEYRSTIVQFTNDWTNTLGK